MRQLSITLLCGIVIIFVAANTALAQSGDTGSLHWEITDGTLTITGEGAMPDYEYGDSPWYSIPITGAVIGNGVTSIGNYAFSDCSGLASVSIGNSVTSIGNSAFSGCSGLTSVTIPNSVTSIGESAFGICSGLTSVTIGNSVTSIGSCAFIICSSLTSVSIPNSVTSIGDDAFAYCSELTSVTIGNGVISIGNEAFYFCPGLTSVTIGNSVTSIGISAFEGCSGLTEVVNLAETPQTITANVFNYVNLSACRQRVPAGSLAAYQAASVWKNFGTIEGITVGIAGNTLAGVTVYGSGNSVCIVNSSGIVLKSVQILDVLGRVVYNGKTNTSVTIPVNSASGIYVVRIVSDNNKVLSTKVHLNN